MKCDIDDGSGVGYIAYIMRKMICLGLVLLCSMLVLLSGCSGRDSVLLRDDGSGRIEAQVVLHPFFIAYLDDIIAGFSNADPHSMELFDLPTLRESMAAIPGLELKRAVTPKRGSLLLDFAFDDVSALFAQDEASPLVFTRRSDGTSEMQFSLNTDTWPAVRSFIPMSQEDGVETFGPQDPPVTPEEYTDLLVFLLEEYADEDAVIAMIKSQRVDLTVRVDGTISESRGFDSVLGREAKVSLPLLDLVTLHNPIELKLVWK